MVYITTTISRRESNIIRLSDLSSFSKPDTMSWSWLRSGSVEYLPDDDYVEVQLITFLDNVGDVRVSVLIDESLAAGGCPG